MVSKLPPSATKAFQAVREIIAKGVYDVPKEFTGSGAPGDYLEFLCNVKRNNFDSPDLNDWEVKFHGGNSLLTLLHKDPQPTGILNKVVNEFGWENKHGNISFRHTIKSKSPRGFRVVNADKRISIVNETNPDIVPFWEHNVILGAIGGKLRRLILVHGRMNRINWQVKYDSAMAYWDFNLSEVFEGIEKGLIRIDFDARTSKERGTALRNHGTKLRVHIKDIGELYDNSELIV
jgi:hypothetical protein